VGYTPKRLSLHNPLASIPMVAEPTAICKISCKRVLLLNKKPGRHRYILNILNYFFKIKREYFDVLMLNFTFLPKCQFFPVKKFYPTNAPRRNFETRNSSFEIVAGCIWSDTCGTTRWGLFAQAPVRKRKR